MDVSTDSFFFPNLKSKHCKKATRERKRSVIAFLFQVIDRKNLQSQPPNLQEVKINRLSPRGSTLRSLLQSARKRKRRTTFLRGARQVESLDTLIICAWLAQTSRVCARRQRGNIFCQRISVEVHVTYFLTQKKVFALKPIFLCS